MRIQNEPHVPGEKLELQHAMLHYHVYRYNKKVVTLLNLYYIELYMHHVDTVAGLLHVNWKIGVDAYRV